MYMSGLLVLGACSYALAAPTRTDMVPRSTPTTEARDNSNNSIPIPGIVIAVIFGVILVAGLVLYLFSSNNILARRGWFQRLRGKNKQQSANKELLNPFDDDQEELTKRASFQSERESIMFNRSRASSLQFAVVEESDKSRRSMSQQIYVLQDSTYVPVQRVDTIQVQQEATAIESSASQRAATISTISPVDDHQSSHSSIPVIITPPLETDQQSRSFEDNMHSTSVDHHEATREQSTPLTS
ncbi:uncharacterized protein TRUGW13939_03185 [Talaromyces rugulosus]|uniref:Uncharacterized protein n=1 Tax=Talaromyces rugulosus TaxID=121627 RepID=A0A7H8QRK6_TALRU|nr:uncharacterized protein TRUGW13939_03185 [Talaromyces rugulosus]QKX56085.1 hypothetical protein TRUGW13939_03185 [Talaromyces rugulosus]